MTVLESSDRQVLRDTLVAGCEAIGCPLTGSQIDQCLRYAELLLETNLHTNLTRIVAPAEVAIKHFVDSLTVLIACPGITERASLADVGTGAGFPGLVLKIARPDLRLTLIDSLGKRLRFLGDVVAELGLKDVTLLHARAEDAGRLHAHRDRHDVVTARAVASLPTLLEWCGPLVKVGGRFVAMKAAGVESELSGAELASSSLGLRLANDVAISLMPTGDDASAARRLLVYDKIQPTPRRYPRKPPEIKSRPLGS